MKKRVFHICCSRRPRTQAKDQRQRQRQRQRQPNFRSSREHRKEEKPHFISWTTCDGMGWMQEHHRRGSAGKWVGRRHPQIWPCPDPVIGSPTAKPHLFSVPIGGPLDQTQPGGASDEQGALAHDVQSEGRFDRRSTQGPGPGLHPPKERTSWAVLACALEKHNKTFALSSYSSFLPHSFLPSFVASFLPSTDGHTSVAHSLAATLGSRPVPSFHPPPPATIDLPSFASSSASSSSQHHLIVPSHPYTIPSPCVPPLS